MLIIIAQNNAALGGMRILPGHQFVLVAVGILRRIAVDIQNIDKRRIFFKI